MLEVPLAQYPKTEDLFRSVLSYWDLIGNLPEEAAWPSGLSAGLAIRRPRVQVAL